MNVVQCDVREDLRTGQPPFHRIMRTVDSLGPDGQMELFTLFEPEPLYRVMSRMGFEHRAERLPNGDWRVLFYRTDAGVAGAGRQQPDCG